MRLIDSNSPLAIASPTEPEASLMKKKKLYCPSASSVSILAVQDDVLILWERICTTRVSGESFACTFPSSNSVHRSADRYASSSSEVILFCRTIVADELISSQEGKEDGVSCGDKSEVARIIHTSWPLATIESSEVRL